MANNATIPTITEFSIEENLVSLFDGLKMDADLAARLLSCRSLTDCRNGLVRDRGLEIQFTDGSTFQISIERRS